MSRPHRFSPSIRAIVGLLVVGGSVVALQAPSFAITPTALTAGDLVVYEVRAPRAPQRPSTSSTTARRGRRGLRRPAAHDRRQPDTLVESGSAQNDGELTLSEPMASH